MLKSGNQKEAREPSRRPFPGRVSAPQSVALRGKSGAKRSLFLEIAAWFALISLVPLLLTGYFNYHSAERDIVADRKEFIQALLSRQSGQVNEYFKAMDNVTEFLSNSPVVHATLDALGSTTAANYSSLPTSTNYQNVLQNYSTRYKNFMEVGISEIYVVNPDGLVVFSAGNDAGALLDLKDPSSSSLAVASLFSTVADKHEIANTGLTLHTQNGKPAFYYGAPVISETSGGFQGMIIVALDDTKFKTVLDNHTGLGPSGETLVVIHENGKFRLLSGGHDTSQDFQQIEPLSGTDLFGDGITPEGKTEVALCQDYRGTDVLAAWTYLPSLHWTLILKLDSWDVFDTIDALRNTALEVSVVTLVACLAAAFFAARAITRPVLQLTEVAERIAHGDLSTEFKCNSNNEIGVLAKAVALMAHNLKSLTTKVKESSFVISSSATQMAATARQQSEAAQSTGASAVEVAATAKQISTTSQELTKTMEEVSNVAQNTAQRAESGLDGLQAIQKTMDEFKDARVELAKKFALISHKAESISGITVTMTKVADQTNLLSLNAAIEARKAGEYGRGFSVVAREIQRLADQTGVATLEIEHAIDEMLQAVSSGVEGMSGFSKKADANAEHIQSVSQQLTDVIQQVQGLPPRFEMVLQGMQSQSEGAGQITGAITQMSESAQQTATAIQEALRLLDQLRETTRILQNEVSLFKV